MLRASGSFGVDTNAVIAYRAGVAAVREVMDAAAALLLPVAVLGELLYGAANSARPVENEDAVREFVAQAVVVPADEAIAVRYAAVRTVLRRLGKPIPENDIWIAATCLEYGVPLLTNDAHFQSVTGLSLHTWS